MRVKNQVCDYSGWYRKDLRHPKVLTHKAFLLEWENILNQDVWALHTQTRSAVSCERQWSWSVYFCSPSTSLVTPWEKAPLNYFPKHHAPETGLHHTQVNERFRHEPGLQPGWLIQWLLLKHRFSAGDWMTVLWTPAFPVETAQVRWPGMCF